MKIVKDSRTFREIFMAFDTSSKARLYSSINKKSGVGDGAIRSWAYCNITPINPKVRAALTSSLKDLFGIDADFDTLFPYKTK